MGLYKEVMSRYVQEGILQIVTDTEAILSETGVSGPRERAMINAYKEIAMLIKIDEMNSVHKKEDES